MPTRFSTEAANADVMGEDPQPSSATEGKPPGPAPGESGDRSGSADAKDSKRRDPKEAEAKPGKDINAPGFVKDKDASKP